MDITAFGHALETINDGLTGFAGGQPVPVPLAGTAIAVDIRAGLAVLRVTRRFVNTEDRPIEAILTMPVGFDAVVTGVKATVGDRVLVAVAKPKEGARAAYEAALDAGKLAVLHEEVLRGLHALSVGNLGAGRDVAVELEAVMPLTATETGPFLRVPVTVGQLYGTSPLAPVDDLATSTLVRHEAELTVRVDAGQVLLGGRPIAGVQRIALDAAIELVVQGGGFGTHQGIAADGRQVRLDLRPVMPGAGALDLAVLVDHSGSTGSPAAGPRGLTVWEAIRDGLRMELGRLRGDDRVALWEFADDCNALGAGTGPLVARLLARLKPPSGGTALGAAVKAALRSGARDILVLTDGQTWAATVDELAASKARIGAILVGPGSLDANIGQLCAMTGGQVFHAAGDDVAASLSLALAAHRRIGRAVEGTVTADAPERVVALRGGVEIVATWSDAMEMRGADATGRFAAALALPLLGVREAEDWARAHGLCTHRTSLILVDEAGEAVEGMAQQRKVPLMAPRPVAFQDSARPRGWASTYSASHSEGYEMSDELDAPMPVLSRSFMDSPLQGLRLDPEAPIRPPVPPEEIRQRFAALRWDALGEDFLAGDLAGLDGAQRSIVGALAGQAGIARMAQALGVPSEAVALALVADLIDDRLARRFLRRVFRLLTVSDWAHLRLWEQTGTAARAMRGG